nr:Holliday junction ATP-dependent DNA helicase RuvB [Leptospira interrogans serovar Copenhageni/Icterohaemorrhagiae]
MVRIGLINRTPAGRVATEKAYRQLKRMEDFSVHHGQDPTLF